MKWNVVTLLVSFSFGLATPSFATEKSAPQAPVAAAEGTSQPVVNPTSTPEKSWIHVMEEKRRIERAAQIEKEKEAEAPKKSNIVKNPATKQESPDFYTKMDQAKLQFAKNRERLEEMITSKQNSSSPLTQKEIDEYRDNYNKMEKEQLAQIEERLRSETAARAQEKAQSVDLHDHKKVSIELHESVK